MLRTGHEGLRDQTGRSSRDASGPFGLHVRARTRMTVTVMSTTSDGGEVNECRVGDAGGECPDGWGKRDGFFYYFERRRHLVAGGEGKRSREREAGGCGKFRDRPTNEASRECQSRVEILFSALVYQLSLIRLPSVLRILRRRVLRRVQVPHPEIFPIVAFHESPANPLAIVPNQATTRAHRFIRQSR